MDYALPGIVVIVALFSTLLSSRANDNRTFFSGLSANGNPPGLWVLTLSQVTTWIFARSLMNAAILGYYYGIWGTLAYATYYLSFLTGGIIIDNLRFRQGYENIQAFLHARFGPWGTGCYNVVVGLRLISEVFANLLVIGILFGVAGSQAYVLSVVGLALVTLFYSMKGGLHASLRTDLLQMMLFIGLLLLLLLSALASGHFTLDALTFKPFAIEQPGPVLMAVALLQIWSYPMHDPVMMDRGFLSDRETTRRSFLHAAWISMICIILFGSLGVLAGANAMAGDTMNQVLSRLLGEIPMLLFSAALVISAMSTLDSTLASASRLAVVNMRLLAPTLKNGRLTMALFMLLGLLLVFAGNKDLFSAVAVSGTASMYLAPVVFFSLWGGRDNIPLWSYLATFVLAITGAALYFTESANYTQWLGDMHKYTKLLYISIGVLGIGCLLFWAGDLLVNRRRSPAAAAARS